MKKDSKIIVEGKEYKLSKAGNLILIKNEILKEGLVKTKTKDMYYEKGKLHRLDGPAVIEYSNVNRSKIIRQQYFTHGHLDRKDGPASIAIYDNDTIEESYYINGKNHRDDGPAIIIFEEKQSVFDKNITIKYSAVYYYLDGNSLHGENQHKEELKIYKLRSFK